MADAPDAPTTRPNTLTPEDICPAQSAADFQQMFNENPQKWFKFIKRANNTIRHQEKLVNALERTQQERDLLQDELQLVEDQNRAAQQPGDDENAYRDQEGQGHGSTGTLTSRVNQDNSQAAAGQNPICTPSADYDDSDSDEPRQPQNLNRRSFRATRDSFNRTESRPKATLPDPDKFNGDSKDLNRWLGEISDKLAVDAPCFGYDNQIMVIYAKNRLTGTAYDTITPLFHNGKRPFKTAEELVNYVKKLFGDPDREANARDELETLQMRGRSFQEYYADFRRIVADIPELSEREQIYRLEKGLSRDMKMALVHGDKEDTNINEYAERCRRVYRRLKKAQTVGVSTGNVGASRNSLATRSEAFVGSTTTSARGTPAVPARRPNLSTPANPSRASDDPRFPRHVPAAKRSERQEAGHCLRCDKPGHGWRNCPHLSDSRATVKVNEATVTSESENEESRA
jgi:retrotransposon gag protein